MEVIKFCAKPYNIFYVSSPQPIGCAGGEKSQISNSLMHCSGISYIEINGQKVPTPRYIYPRSKLTRMLNSAPAVCPFPASARPQSFIHSGRPRRGAGSFAQSFVHSIHQYSFFFSFFPSFNLSLVAVGMQGL